MKSSFSNWNSLHLLDGEFALEVGLWDNSESEVEFVNLNDVNRIEIEVVSGDEIANVFYKNGDFLRIDPGKDTRISEFCKGAYTLYDLKRGINRLADFLHRKEPYDMFKGLEVYEDNLI